MMIAVMHVSVPRSRVMAQLYAASRPGRELKWRDCHEIFDSPHGDKIRRLTTGAIRLRRHALREDGREASSV